MDKELPTNQDRALGCMVGGAAGDALGYAVEFEQWRQIKARYGDRGISQYELDHRELAPISDDTQMSLFTAAGVLLGMTRGHMRGVMGRIDGYCRFTYLDWLHTQEWKTRKEGERVDSWLMDVQELYARRAPGNTCITVLKGLEAREDVRNDSCGCGGVMRTAPIALICYLHKYGGGNLEYCDMVAAQAARLTHRHPLGFMPSAVLNDILMQILDGKAFDEDSLRQIVKEASDRLPSIISEEDNGKTYGELWPGAVARLQGILRQALDLAQIDMPDVEAIERIGGGWTGHEALAIAIYSAVKHADNFEDAIVSAVNHSGDSDSTGAICGNIVGCLLGRNAIPSHYTDHLELLDVIEEMANDLYTGCIISEYNPIDTPEKLRWAYKYMDFMRPVDETKHYPASPENEIAPGRIRTWYLGALNRVNAPYNFRVLLRDVEPQIIPFVINGRIDMPYLGGRHRYDKYDPSLKDRLRSIQTDVIQMVSREICEWPGWEPESIKEYALSDMQFFDLRGGYIPHWDERYGVYYSQGWLYIFRSGHIFKKFRYEERAGGIWIMKEMFTTAKFKEFGFDIWDDIYSHVIKGG